MSAIGKTPLIENILSTVSDENLVALLDAIDGKSGVENFDSGLDLRTNGTIGLVSVIINGLLLNGIYVNHYLLAYSKNSQQLSYYKIDSNGNYEKEDEYLDIDELRDCLHRELSPKTIYVDNIQELTDAQINSLRAGDVVVKKTGNLRHSYRVSYKENNQGICLTYCDASLVETVSYDYTEGHWIYNSTDSTSLS